MRRPASHWNPSVARRRCTQKKEEKYSSAAKAFEGEELRLGFWWGSEAEGKGSRGCILGVVTTFCGDFSKFFSNGSSRYILEYITILTYNY